MKKTLLILSLFSPMVVSAVTTTSVDTLITTFSIWIERLIPIIISLAILAFLWGIFRYVVASSDEDKAKGRSVMIWGVVGIFVMVSVWGLVNVIQKTFDIDSDAAENVSDLVPIMQ